ncbi:MAG TPA: DUF4340 domain-containing protein [Acidobacteriaceae bacterium]|jgi:hypothetical protein|nr:DUF4340 domain-containing protein [Acidobacteriaceae bacterium]
MKLRGLLIAVVVLAILGGVLYWSSHRKTPPTPASAENTPSILKIDPSSVTALTIMQKESPPVTLTRSGTNQWRITAPQSTLADAGTVSGILSSLNPLASQRVLSDKAPDLAPYGLQIPSVTIDLTEKNNKSQKLLLGDATPTGDAVYAALAGDPRVFTAASYIKNSLDKSFDDLRDKRLLPVDSASVTTIDLDRKTQPVDFGRVQSGWQIQKPEPYRTNTFQVQDLLTQLTSAKMDTLTTPEASAKAFAHAAPFATARITGSFGTDTLEVRKDRDDDYAKSSVLPGVFKVASDNSTALAEALNRPLDDYRDKQLFSFSYADPDKIEVHTGATSLVLTHAATTWTSNGQTMDTASAESLVSALRDLAATKFVASGFTAPEIDITVTYAGGKKTDHVQIAKTKDGGIAKRDDGPSLYQLDAVTLNELTNAVKGVKPASLPKKK